MNVNVKSVNKVGAGKLPITKKINMGAATNFGKNDLGINSPTHTEQSFSANNNVTNNSNNDLLDDLFNSSPNKTKSNLDDFNPRAEETQEFGDFTSAFGGPSTQKPTNEFADFGQAFVSSTNINTTTTTSLEDTLFDIPAAVNPQYENISNVDLFGNNSISQSMSTSNNSDLLSDFGSLYVNTQINSGKFNFFYIYLLLMKVLFYGD